MSCKQFELMGGAVVRPSTINHSSCSVARERNSRDLASYLTVHSHMQICSNSTHYSNDLPNREPLRLSSTISAGVDTYDHTHWKIRDPVRSPIDKPVRGGLVVGSVTTSESPLLYVFLMISLPSCRKYHCTKSVR
jgi:hypothetical protein